MGLEPLTNRTIDARRPAAAAVRGIRRRVGQTHDLKVKERETSPRLGQALKSGELTMDS